MTLKTENLGWIRLSSLPTYLQILYLNAYEVGRKQIGRAHV